MEWVLVIGVVIVAIGVPVSRLKRPFLGLVHAIVGATLAGGLSFGAAVFWLVYLYTPPKPRNDSDWGSAWLAYLVLFGVPFLCTLVGFVLSLVHAFWLERHPRVTPLSKPEPLDL